MTQTLVLFPNVETQDTDPYPLDEAELLGLAQGWLPVTLSDMEWIIGKVMAAETEARTIRDRAERLAGLRDAQAAWWRQRYEPELRAIVSAELVAQRGKKRSVDVLTGTAGFRAKAAKIVVDKDQEAAALEWVKANLPDAVKEVTTISLSRSTLFEALVISEQGRAIFPVTGEPLDFAYVEPATDNFYLKAGN